MPAAILSCVKDGDPTTGRVRYRLNPVGAMKTLFSFGLLALAIAATTDPAEAKGCLKGAAAGALAGHYVGHSVIGAISGCYMGHHIAHQPKRPQPQGNEPTTKPSNP